MATYGPLRQISLSSSYLLGSTHNAPSEEEAYLEELKRFRQNLIKSCNQWPLGFDVSASPLPLLVPESLLSHLETLGGILCRAITSIVERWWTDTAANFPQRMPLLAHQEAVLRWIDGDGNKSVPPFSSRRGAWRPDFLFNAPGQNEPTIYHGSYAASANKVLQNPQICEINARFSFNGFFCSTFAHEAYEERGLEPLGLKSPVEPSKVFAAFKNLIDPSKPIHLLKGTEPGLDIHLFKSYIGERCGLDVRFIRPEDLRLIPSTNSAFGTMLCCVLDTLEAIAEDEVHSEARKLFSSRGERVEQIHQVALELHQWELQDLGEDMLKALAPLCFNDLRTIYLVHDKRMLGIVLQELGSLVEKHCILSKEEAEFLRKGIVRTILPGSPELKELICRAQSGSEVKDDYLLKPVASGKGDGIIFGTDLTTAEWIGSLLSLSEPQVARKTYVVQRIVKQPKFNVLMPDKTGKIHVQRNHYVGTFMMLNGKHLGIACWRTGPERICAVSHGGTWMCTLIRDPVPTSTSYITTSNVPRQVVFDPRDARNASHISMINGALQKYGILIVSLSFPDPDSTYLLDLVQGFQYYHSHGAPLSHSSTRGWFWDVKPTPKVASKQHYARSESMADFPWHTDCSYASEPPKFFGLHVLQADRCGGGTLSVLQLSKVLRQLRKDTIDALFAEEYKIEVPPEFENGMPFVIGSVLTRATGEKGDLLQTRCRYRADIIHPLTNRAVWALEDLNMVLSQARSGESDLCLNLTPQMIPNGSIVLMDNGRWLHARNEVKDPERHLRRIRWDARQF